jgi:low affinity Fe/Cu permease
MAWQDATRPSRFDRFAERSSDIASKAPFFLVCVLVVILWLPTIVFMSVNSWQLVIGTITSIVTLLLVALLQNAQTRNTLAINLKLDALAEALADVMRHQSGEDSDLHDDIRELEQAVGLESRVSTTPPPADRSRTRAR